MAAKKRKKKKARRGLVAGKGGRVYTASQVTAGKQRAKKQARKAVINKRIELHQAAALLKNFHGGKLPIKSGCGRPRKRGAGGLGRMAD